MYCVLCTDNGEDEVKTTEVALKSNSILLLNH